MLGRVTVVQDDKKAVCIVFDAPVKFKPDEQVNVTRKRKQRTLKQNRMYWAYLTWCIHPAGGNLQEMGHFSTDALHEDIKAWFKETHKEDFEIIDGKFSTAELDRQAFKRFFDIVNQELMVEFFEIDTSGYWRDYEKYGAWGMADQDFRAWMDEEQEIPF